MSSFVLVERAASVFEPLLSCANELTIGVFTAAGPVARAWCFTVDAGFCLVSGSACVLRSVVRAVGTSADSSFELGGEI